MLLRVSCLESGVCVPIECKGKARWTAGERRLQEGQVQERLAEDELSRP